MPTSCTGSRRHSHGNRSAARLARPCMPSASHWRPSSRSAASPGLSRGSANNPPGTSSRGSPAITSRPRHRRAAASSRRRGSAATRRTNGRRSSTASCRAGTPPTRPASSAISASARAGDQGQGPLSLKRAAQAHGIPRAAARGARAVPSLRGERIGAGALCGATSEDQRHKGRRLLAKSGTTAPRHYAGTAARSKAAAISARV